MRVDLLAVGFSDPKFFDAGWGRLLTTPTLGGLAVLLAACLAFLGNAWNIRSNRRDTDKKIAAARTDLDKKINADGEDNDRKLAAAREEAIAARTAAKRADAYVAIIEVDERIGRWVQFVHRAVGDEVVELPEASAQVLARAQLLAFGTLQVREAWDEWQKQVQSAVVIDARIRQARRVKHDHVANGGTVRAGPEREDAAYLELQQLRPVEFARREALHTYMNAELAEGNRSGRPADSPPSS